MALSEGLINTYWRRYNQRRALTGLPSSYQEMRGTLDPMLESAANKDLEEARLRYQHDMQSRALSMQEQAQKDAARASTISGIAQTGGLLAGGALTLKSLNNTAAANNRLLSILEGRGPMPGTQPGGYLSAGVGSGGAPVLPGVGSGGVPLTTAVNAPATVSPVTYGSVAGEMGGGTIPTAGTSVLSSVPPIVGAFGAQYLTGKALQPALDKAGFPMAGKGWTYGGVLGATTGGMLDLGKKALDSVGSFASDVFGW